MMKKCFLVGAILAAAIACQNPLTNIAKPTDASTRSITVSWHVAGSQARTIYPTSYPTPSTYDVLLHPTSGNDLSQTGLTSTSWTFNNLQAVVYAITVNGKDSGGNVIVTGSGSADLSSVAVQNPAITLNYISTGSGTGQIHLSFDASSAGVAVSATAFTLVDPMGAVVVNGASLSGSSPTFIYSNTSAVVGTYKMFAKFTGNGKVAMKDDTIIVVQGVDTAVTVTLISADFSGSYVAVSGLSLNTHTMSLTVGGATGNLGATLSPSNASNILVSWSSSAPSVATVDQSGVVTPGAMGTATPVTITATSVDNQSAHDSCSVTVGGTVTYNPNGATSGSVPVDSNTYTLSQPVPVLGNSGNLANSGYTFAGWNTAADGSGTSYSEGNTFAMPGANVTLYAVWNKQINGGVTINQPPIYTVTISGPTTLNYGSQANFTSSYAGTPSAFAWYLDSSTTPIGTASTLSITPTVSTYTYGGHLLMLVITDINGLSYAESVVIAVQN